MKCTIDAKSPAIIFSIIVAYCSSEFRRGRLEVGRWVYSGHGPYIPKLTERRSQKYALIYKTKYSFQLCSTSSWRFQVPTVRQAVPLRHKVQSLVLQKLDSAQLGLGL